MDIEQPKFVLDANTFIQAARHYYSFDIAQSFWDNLVCFAADDKIVSIDKVFQEMKEGRDKLRDWAINDFSNYFDTTQTSAIVQRYADLMQWAERQTQYNQNAKDDFMDDSNADAWVLAYAKANDCILVTLEIFRPDRKKSIPIPNVCDAFNIRHCNTFKMLKDLKFTF